MIELRFNFGNTMRHARHASNWARTGLLLLLGSVMSCNRKPVQVLDYAQANSLTRDYLLHYKPGRKIGYWVGPPTSCIRLRRVKPSTQAIIVGHVVVREESGALRPGSSAIISIDRSHTFADERGDYARLMPPGRHSMRIGWVGTLCSEAPVLRVRAGDSIRTNTQLLNEPRPSIN